MNLWQLFAIYWGMLALSAALIAIGVLTKVDPVLGAGGFLLFVWMVYHLILQGYLSEP
jgi:hypothetical protein